MSGPLEPAPAALPERIRAILATRGLTMADISREARSRFSGSRLHHIPHNFYAALRNGSFSPSLHQVFALSALSDYRFVDWLAIFGFSLDDPARFQASILRSRTTELDARVYDRRAPVRWFEESRPAMFGPLLTPLGQWLTGSTVRLLDTLPGNPASSFRYLKIGRDDAYAFPDLLPGSIVRIDSRVRQEQLVVDSASKSLFALEHSQGLVCCRVRRTVSGHIALCPKHLPFAQVEFELGTNARILGVADLEIRLLANVELARVPVNLGKFWNPAPFKPNLPFHNAGECIRNARLRCGLSFREASAHTRNIAQTLQHPGYFCAPSALSDYEARNLPPRHIHKLISICAVYSLAVNDVFEAAGFRPGDAGQEPMPDEFSNRLDNASSTTRTQPSPFLTAIEQQFQEVPYFLRGALPTMFGLKNLSIRDIFWAGSTRQFAQSYLAGTAFLVVNRKNKAPKSSLSSPMWAQPLYVLQKRDGSYLCAACSLENSTVLIRPSTAAARNHMETYNRGDVEVVGQVIGTIRQLL